MQKYSMQKQWNIAWWSGRLSEFVATAPEVIVGALAQRLVETHSVNYEAQIRAWRDQIAIIRAASGALPSCRILFEYPIIRLGRRIDVVIVTHRAIFVLEFKTEAVRYSNADRQQTEDYALDLFDFHAGSSNHPIIPILVAGHAAFVDMTPPLFWHAVAPVIDANPASLAEIIQTIMRQMPAPQRPLNIDDWEACPYRPVPSIVEAATMLYRKHGVSDIASARADVANLTRTTDVIRAAIAMAKSSNSYIIVFVTGIPGAGKTLCGLNAVFTADQSAAFLTGNLPLVHVLRAALARDAREQGRTIRDATHKLDASIQPLLGFLRDNQPRREAPHEHVIIFDEAQRAWDAAFGRRKFDLPNSEAGGFNRSTQHD